MKKTWIGFLVMVSGLFSCAGGAVTREGLCGNGDLNFGEECDGELFSPRAPYSCILLGYNSPGRPLCSADCTIDPAPCVDSGSCGDGLVTPVWEACDGKDNGGETCASLGYHGGRLFCHGDCRFDISQCLRCGDGVVQPEYGELVETGPRSCLDAGFLGGALYTDDCVTTAEDLCGEYALIEPAGSLSHPVITLLPDGSIGLTGRATGAFAAFPDSEDWCPLLTEVFDLSTDPPRVVGYKHDPICEREFFAVRRPGEVEQILYQREVEAPVVRQVDLGAPGLVNLRQANRVLQLERIDLAGSTQVSSRLDLDARFSTPQLDVLPGGTVGVSSLDLEGLALAIFDPVTGVVRRVSALDRVLVDGRWWRPEPTLDHRVIWLSEDQWWVFAKFSELDGVGAFHGLLRVKAEGGRFAVAQVIQGLPAPAWGPNLQQLRHLGDRLELTSAHNDVDVASVSRIVVPLGGGELAGVTQVLPNGARIEALFVEADGSVVLAGVAPSAGDPEPDTQRCRPAGTSLVRWRLDPALETVRTRHFRTSAARWDFFSEPDFCNSGARSWVLRDGVLMVAGSYDLMHGFCSDRERVPMLKGLPVHTCGIYLVRFE